MITEGQNIEFENQVSKSIFFITLTVLGIAIVGNLLKSGSKEEKKVVKTNKLYDDIKMKRNNAIKSNENVRIKNLERRVRNLENNLRNLEVYGG